MTIVSIYSRYITLRLSSIYKQMSVLVVLHCGFLEKEKSKSFLGGWNKRWFTLDSDSLCYYREKSDIVAADTIKLLYVDWFVVDLYNYKFLKILVLDLPNDIFNLLSICLHVFFDIYTFVACNIFLNSM